MTFALQALGLRYIVENGRSLTPHVYSVPEEMDQYVANLRLQTWNVNIDKLSEEQQNYLASWAE
jgi:adenosylhomocysteinase